jgi:probable HAF family extracellular repeat protein
MLMHLIRKTDINHILRATSVAIGVLVGTQILSAYEYRIKELGPVDRHTYPGALNNLGVAVFTAHPEGSSEDITIPGAVYTATESGWSAMSGLGGAYDVVLDINSHGSAVGHSNVGDIHATPTSAVIYKNGQAQDLGISPGSGSYATALNDSEQVVGYASLPGEQHAFLYTAPGNVIDLGTPGFSSAAFDINETGQVVGSSWGFDADEIFSEDAFLYTNGQMLMLGTLGGKSSSATAINNLGQIVGGSRTAADENHAFIYDPINGMRDIGSPGLNSDATDVNDHGTVIGSTYSPTSGRQAMIYDEFHGIQYLFDLIPTNSGWTSLDEARSINNSGQILGQGIFQGESRIFLLTPLAIPEPSAVMLAILAATSFACRRRVISRQSQNRR